MPGFSNFASQVKAHHESLNAAYSAYYSPRASMSATPDASRKSSTVSQDSQSERNITKAWKALKKHHAEMNEAYAVFYSPGVHTAGTSHNSSRATSANQTPRVSFEEQRAKADMQSSQPRNYQKMWRAMKNRAVEHHRSVSNASAAVYGA